MTEQLPQKLMRSPLREALFEMRFEPAMPAAGDVLPGLLYSNLKDRYPQVTPLPMANVPRPIRDKNPELLYQPSHRLQGNLSSVQVGDRVVTLATIQYPGWNQFKAQLESLVHAVKGTGLARHIERFSFKYVNVIEASVNEKQLSLLNARIELLGDVPMEKGLHLRAEIDDGKCITIIQIAPNTAAKLMPSAQEISGLLIDVDTIRPKPGSDFWATPAPLLEEVHSVAKNTFFSLLTKPALDRLQPSW